MLQEDRLRGGLLVCGVSRRAVPAAGARSGSVAGEVAPPTGKLSTGAPRTIARPRSEGPTYSGFTPSPVHAIVGAWLCSPAAGILTPCKRPGWSITATCASARSPCARAIQPIPTCGAGAVASIRDDLSPGNARTERRRASRPRAREVKSRIALPAPRKTLLVKAVAWDWSRQRAMLKIGYRLTTVLAYPQSKNAETRSVDNNLLRANSQAALMLHRGIRVPPCKAGAEGEK